MALKVLVAKNGAPGTLCVRLWTKTTPGAREPDYLVCGTTRTNSETMRDTVFETQPGSDSSRSARHRRAHGAIAAMTLRFLGQNSRSGARETIDFIAEAADAGCTRVSCVDTAPEAPKTATFELRGSSSAGP